MWLDAFKPKNGEVQNTGRTPGAPEKHGKLENVDALALFQFDLMDQDIAAGNTADELRRVNNITWRLMTAKGFTFNEAIEAAAKWVVNNEQHQDEAGFVDVLALFTRMQQPITKESPP